ncbi:MAG TPA: hypothetical protein DC000_11840 [Clostridiales bacterium]|nr:hypothetical protein [Clostridiales bacterium]
MNNKVLYHYCSLKNFYNIMESRKIWLNDALQTNDSAEMKLVISKLIKILKDKIDMKEIDLENFFNQFENVYSSIISNFFKPHIACFSDDGDMLNQWRCYGNNGQGIAIGFNLDYFENIKNYDSDRDFIIERVIYSDEEQEQLLLNTVFELLDKKDKFFNINNMNYLSLVGKIFKLGQIFKNSSFEYEKEIRLIHGNSEMAAEPDMFKYRATEDNIVSYLEVPLDIKNVDKKAINEVIIGPKCKITQENLRYFCFNYYELFDVDFKIKKSKSTYI